MAIQVLGLSQLGRDFARLADAIGAAPARAIFRRAAGKMRDSVRNEIKSDSGLLKRAVISFGSKRRGSRVEPTAFARVNVLKGRIRAPHGGLVATGTSERRPRTHKFLRFLGRGGGIVFARRVRPMPANPYFDRAVQKSGNRVIHEVASEMGELLRKT